MKFVLPINEGNQWDVLMERPLRWEAPVNKGINPRPFFTCPDVDGRAGEVVYMDSIKWKTLEKEICRQISRVRFKNIEEMEGSNEQAIQNGHIADGNRYIGC